MEGQAKICKVDGCKETCVPGRRICREHCADSRREYCAKYYAKYREKNKDKRREHNREYYEKNKDKIREYVREYYKKNKDKRREYAREYAREYREKNKDKIREGHLEYEKKNKDKRREAVLRRKYGMSLADYEAQLTAQRGLCAICRSPLRANLAVDHCHTTGHVRGIVHTRCNTAIGLLKDDPRLLRHAAEYLETAQAIISLLEAA